MAFAAALGALMAAGAALGDNAMHVRRVAPDPVPQPNELTFRPLTVHAPDGVRLYGRFIPSPARSRSRCVVLLHGIGDNSANGLGLGRLMAGIGYSALLTDSRAHGQSGGALATYGVLERYDVTVWLDKLASMEECRGGIYAYGASMGAGILLQTLPSEHRLKAVVAECPFSSFPEVARHRIRGYFHTTPRIGAVLAPPLVFGGVLYARLRHGIDLASAAPVESVAGAKTPILLIHGDADDNIPIEQSREIVRRNPAIQLWVVPGARHTEAASTAPDAFRQHVFAWFDSH